MNILAKILNPKGLLIGLGIIIGFFFVRWITSFQVVKKEVVESYKETIKTDSANIAFLANELQIKSDTISAKDTVVVFQSDRIKELQQLLKETKIVIVRSQDEAKQATEAIEHYEENGLMRYFVFDRKGIFHKGCFQEVFEKPDNICK